MSQFLPGTSIKHTSDDDPIITLGFGSKSTSWYMYDKLGRAEPKLPVQITEGTSFISKTYKFGGNLRTETFDVSTGQLMEIRVTNQRFVLVGPDAHVYYDKSGRITRKVSYSTSGVISKDVMITHEPDGSKTVDEYTYGHDGQLNGAQPNGTYWADGTAISKELYQYIKDTYGSVAPLSLVYSDFTKQVEVLNNPTVKGILQIKLMVDGGLLSGMWPSEYIVGDVDSVFNGNGHDGLFSLIRNEYQNGLTNDVLTSRDQVKSLMASNPRGAALLISRGHIDNIKYTGHNHCGISNFNSIRLTDDGIRFDRIDRETGATGYYPNETIDRYPTSIILSKNGIKRSYSIASHSKTSTIKLLIKKVQGGKMSH
jgi:hypothetical protein